MNQQAVEDTSNTTKVQILKDIDLEDRNWQNIGLEMLVELSKKGEIDPWNVDLIYVIDKFLSEIKQEELQQAGEIIFFVSVLLRIKSEHIYNREDEIPDDDLIDFDELEYEALNGEKPNDLRPEKLDMFLIRNQRGLREKRRRQITLNDLIKLFETIEPPKQRKSKKKVSMEDFEEDYEIAIREDEELGAMDLAHEENLEEKIKLLSEHILEVLKPNHQTLLKEIEKIFGGQVDTFLSALFLSHSGKTEIIQEEFYKDIWLKRIT